MIWSTISFRTKVMLFIAIIIVTLTFVFRPYPAGNGVLRDNQDSEKKIAVISPNKVKSRSAKFADSFIIIGTSTRISEDDFIEPFDPTNLANPNDVKTSPVPVSKPKPASVETITILPAPKPLTPEDYITAESYIVGNLDTGEIYFKRAPNNQYSIASVSKLVTALVAIDMMKPDQKITITQTMLEPYGEEGGLRLGETVMVSELMYPLILESSNDAAEALAEAAQFDLFINRMNTLVSGLNMPNTHFDEPSGLSPGDVSTATDLFTFARYIYNNEKSLLTLTRLPQYSLATTTDRGAYTFRNSNPFVFDPHYIGGKTGRTSFALESMLSMFDYEIKGKKYPLVIIVLRSKIGSRQYDMSALYGRTMRKLELMSI